MPPAPKAPRALASSGTLSDRGAEGKAAATGNAKSARLSRAPAWALTDGTGKTISLAQYEGRPVVVIFYRGYGCLQCMEQLNNFAGKAREFEKQGIKVVAISTDAPDKLNKSLAPYKDKGGFPFPLVSDAKLDVFKAYRCLDFDDQPLHGTFLVDAQGRIRFRNISDEPFNNPSFLLNEGRELLGLASAD